MDFIKLLFLILVTGLVIGATWKVARIPGKKEWLERFEWMPRHRTVLYNVLIAAWAFAAAGIALLYYMLFADPG